MKFGPEGSRGWVKWLILAGRLIIAGIFIYAGYAKLREPWLQFVVSLNSFKILPENTLEPIARTLPWIEVALGVVLVTGILARWSSLIASLMLATFVGAGFRAWAMGLQVDCGCFGSGSSETIGGVWFLEHGGMLALAAAVTIGAFLLSPGRRQKSVN
ncbi:MAG TPA: MauE/DoxX family redox-associated membrane protein [Bryobacteraceae bacterium]|jgi:uncharacterized membrane protein YphA (DoxX/SURF4 family)|nr:MauE/DoxX family redox-associated membrane protein [Bryobacteraceae bacterium]